MKALIFLGGFITGAFSMLILVWWILSEGEADIRGAAQR